MKRILRILTVLFLAAAAGFPVAAHCYKGLPVTPVTVERLPDLSVPRTGHAVLFTQGGELTVMGGHTTGFIPVQTAEWFDGAAWHTVPMTYTHDHATVLPLSSGKVLLAGGHEQPLGIGQTFTVETYDPATHTFSSFGSLDQKRCFASAAELDSGRVVIGGTWYAKDGLELWDGSRANRSVKAASAARSCPYILRTSRDEAIVFGSEDEHATPLKDAARVDRLRGEAYDEPILHEWHPFVFQTDYRSYTSFVGDEETERYAYLLLLQNDSDQLALALVDGGRFSLLPSDYDVPTEYEGRRLYWTSRFVADRQRGRGFFVGNDDEMHLYALRVDYADALKANKGAARLSLYVTDAIAGGCVCVLPVVSPEGDLVIAGGSPHNDNFNPTAAVYRLSVAEEATAEATSHSLWWLAAGGLLLLVAAVLIIICMRRSGIRNRKRAEEENLSAAGVLAESQEEADENLFGHMRAYLVGEQRFCNPAVRLSDVAAGLHASVRDLSAVLRRKGFRSFPDFVNALRIDYACTLLRQQPNMKIRTLSVAAGFSSESAFYSAFNSRTGTTPKQWVAEQAPSE